MLMKGAVHRIKTGIKIANQYTASVSRGPPIGAGEAGLSEAIE